MARKPASKTAETEQKPAPHSPPDNASPKTVTEGHPLGIVVVTH